jgi:hypothetical protein
MVSLAAKAGPGSITRESWEDHSVSKAKDKKEVELDRRGNKSDDRRDSDRRSESKAVGAERRATVRRKVQRRRQIDPTTCERDYSNEEIEFMQAMDAYKRANGRMFPTCSEILEVIRELGYQRVGVGGVAKTSPVEETETEATDEAVTE